MADHPHPGHGLDEELELDKICFEFEQLLRAGKQPRIESFLADHAEPFRSRLLEQLVLLELDQSDTNNSDLWIELAARFPTHEDVIRRAVRVSTVGETSTSRGSKKLIGSRLGQYRLLEKIGEGGMGVVYCAEQTSPIRRTVALKVLKPGLESGQVIARFEAERQALALMNHEHIARVLGAGTLDDGRPFFAMEYVHGVPITDYCDAHQLSIRKRLKLFSDVCLGVHHAHQKGVIHRDIKPSNVLVAEVDSRATPKVIDFGIAKALGQRLTDRTLHTNLGSMIGTPAYMSPEQAGQNAHDVDTRSDVYSLGVLAYELVTGSTPISRERLKEADFESVRKWIREEEPERPSIRCQRTLAETPEIAKRQQIEPMRLHLLRTELDWVIIRALEKDRKRRYESASALADDIQRFLNDQPVEARPPSVAYKIDKFARRNKATLVAGLVIVFGLLIATAVSSWLAIDAIQARKLADRRFEGERQALERVQSALTRAHAAEKAADQRAQELEHRVYSAVFKNAIDARDRGDLTAMTTQLDLCATQHRHWEWSRLRRGRMEIRPAWTVRAHDVQIGVHQARWTPNGNGFLSVGVDRLAKIWELGQNEPSRTFSQHNSEVIGIAMSPDGNLVATIVRKGRLIVWNARSEELIWRSHDQDVWRGVDVSPDGKRVAAAGLKALTVWELATGETVWSSKSETEVEGVRFSSDGTRILTGGFVMRTSNTRSSGPARLWDAMTGKQLGEFGVKVGVDDAAFFPAGDRIVCGTVDGRVVIYDLSTNREVLTFRVRPEAEEIKCVEVSPDGQWIATAGVDREFGIWSAANGEIACVAVGHDVGRIRSLDFHPTENTILSSSVDRTVRAWDFRVRPPRDFALPRHGGAVTACKFSPDSKLIATMSTDGTVRLRSTNTGAERLRLSGLTGESVDFDSSGERLLIAADRRLLMCRATDATLIREFRGHPQKIDTAIFSPDDQLIATCGKDKVVRIFETSTGRLVHALSGHKGYSIYSIAFSPDGTRLASAGVGAVKIWDVSEGRQVSELTIQDESFTAVDFGGRNDTVLAAAHEAREVLMIAVDTGRVAGSFSGHHFDGLRAIATSSDGRRLVTADDRGGAVLWNTSTETDTMLLSTLEAPILALDFSPDNRLIAVARRDGSCTLLEATASNVEQYEQRQHLALIQPVVDSLIAQVADPETSVATLNGSEELETTHRQLAIELVNTPRVHESEFASRLGEALWREGRIAEAEELLVKGYQQLKRSKPQPDVSQRFRTGQALERVVQFFESQTTDDSHSKATKWRKVQKAFSLVETCISDQQYVEAGIIDLFAQATHTDRIQLDTHQQLRDTNDRDPIEFIDRAATWRYAVDDPPPHWRELDFDDDHWAAGPAPLGFGDSREATTLKRGRAAYALRHTFTIEKGLLPRARILQLSFACDDGIAIYLNGTPLWRRNVPEGRVDLTTLALGGAENEDRVYSHRLDMANSLLAGKNVIAASVHQSTQSSSDLHFLLGLSAEWTAAASLASLGTEELTKSVAVVERHLRAVDMNDWIEPIRFAFADDPLPPPPGAHPSTNWLRRARVQAALGHVDEAIVAYGEGLAANPTSSETRDELLREREQLLVMSSRAEVATTLLRNWVAEQFGVDGVLRINCGGPSFADGTGAIWHADRFCDAPRKDVSTCIRKLAPFPLYHTSRWFPYWVNAFHGYRIPVIPGRYRVELHFADCEFSDSGQRVFDIHIEGELRQSGFDAIASAQADLPTRIEFDVNSDDWMDIAFMSRIESPMISAIVLQPLDK